MVASPLERTRTLGIQKLRWPQVDAFLVAAGKLSPAKWKVVHRRTRRAEPKFLRMSETRRVALARMWAAEASSKAAEKRLREALDHYEDVSTDIRALQVHDSRKAAENFVMTLRYAVEEVNRAHMMKSWLERTAPGQDALLVRCGLFEGLVPKAVLPYPLRKQKGDKSSLKAAPARASSRNTSPPAEICTPDEWASRWRTIAKSVRAHGGAAKRIAIGKPATEASVRSVEKKLGIAIPAAFRESLRTFASRARFEWTLPDEASDERAEFAHANGFA